jgi:hypothetical protein
VSKTTRASAHWYHRRMRITAITIALALVPAPLLGAPNCKKGKPCGNTCIAVSKTCHVGGGFATSDPKPRKDAPEPPPEAKHARRGEDVIEGFGKANEAVEECRELHGQGGQIAIEAWIGSEGEVLSANPIGSNGLDQLGWCVAKAVAARGSFVPSTLPSEKVTHTFELAPLDVPPPSVEPEPSGPPTPKPCRREDFEEFDAFVECQVEQQSQAKPATPPPALQISPAEAARQQEAAEARTELGRKAKEQAAANAEEELRTRRTLLALVISGSVLDAAGIGLVAAAATATGSPDDGPTCTVGKRCGDTCIAVELTCHTPTAGGSIKSNPALFWPGIATLAIGSGLLVTALIIYRRRNSQTSSLIVTTRGVGFRF